METFKKYWGFVAMIVGGVIGVYGWVYNQGSESQSLEGRVFDSPEQKVVIVSHVEEGPTPEQQQRAILLDSVNSAHAIKSRAMRDSVYLLETKARKKTDSIILLNADQMYQIKEEIKKLKEN